MRKEIPKNLIKNVKKNYLAVLNCLAVLMLIMVLPITILTIYTGINASQFDSLLVIGVAVLMIPSIAVNFFGF